MCSVKTDSQVQRICIGCVMGVFDNAAMMRAEPRIAEVMANCPWRRVTYVDTAIKYANNNPEILDLPAPAIIPIAFAKAGPCQNQRGVRRSISL